MRKYRFIFYALLPMFILFSCMEREEFLPNEADTISFTSKLQKHNNPQVKSFSKHFTSESDDWDMTLSTKVPITTQLQSQVKVLGYLYSNTFDENVSQWDILSSAKYKINGDELTSTSAVRWGQIPKSYNFLRIYAYTPVSIPGAVLPDVGPEAKGAPSITYTLPKSLDDHTDIIAAVKEVPTKTADGEPFNQTIALTFNHVLTALKFKMGFACTVHSITISGVYNKGTYTIGSGWSGLCKYTDDNIDGLYTVSFPDGGKILTEGGTDVTTSENVMMMLPQTVPSGATITVSYTEGNISGTISASLDGIQWEEGKLITYTLHKEGVKQNEIYIDLAAGNFTVDDTWYSGWVYTKNGEDNVKVNVKDRHSSKNIYHIYQSSSYNRKSTGWSGAVKESTFTPPSYNPVTVNVNGTQVLWSDFITNNTSVESVIETWNRNNSLKDFNRDSTSNFIKITTTTGTCNLVLDNLFSTKQSTSNVGTDEGIVFVPAQLESSSSKLVLTLVGDNRFGNIYYMNQIDSTNQLIFEGTGSLTVCDVDRVKSLRYPECGNGYSSNWWKGVIGSNDSDGGPDNSYGIVFNSGVIFAGSTKAENATAIGGGGNGEASITINGGVITAVATTTGAAIGGGMAINAEGGGGYVIINGGNVYAYNFENGYNIPSAAIGGGGSKKKKGNYGNVLITGGNIYAYSVGGSAIGGGSSETNAGGDAHVHITGGNVVAISAPGVNMPAGAGIGGGTGGNTSGVDGGKAYVKIEGNPIIRTGSIGGGKTNSSNGYIGSAEIIIESGDIQAQFVMASGAATPPKFTMSGGTIRNSYTSDEEYVHIQSNGGAVYMEDGEFIMSGGIIANCKADFGGAIYIKRTSATRQPSFNMSGGYIENCISTSGGGALYMDGGNVTLHKGTINNNITQDGNGGAIFIKGGNFIMPEQSTAAISKNACYTKSGTGKGSGGGIYITSSSGNVEVDVLSGSITGNSSDRNGGGLSVDLGKAGSNVSATVKIGASESGSLTVPLISGNSTSVSGGGLYVSGQNANIIINGGNISGNITSGHVANQDVANLEGMVTLNGGNVNSVTVTYDANGGYVGTNENVTTVTQKIVTSTRSKMVLPATFTRLGWKLVGWHTRPDGDDSKGRFYATGDILNLSINTTLFAQWEE